MGLMVVMALGVREWSYSSPTMGELKMKMRKIRSLHIDFSYDFYFLCEK